MNVQTIAFLSAALMYCCAPTNDEAVDEDPGAGTSDPADALAAADLTETVAEAWCMSVLRCCDDADVEWAFSAWAQDDRLADLHNQLPPLAAVDETTCPDIVSEALTRTWLGSWLAANEAGLVGYDGAAAAECVTQLETAECGDALRTALTDNSCFASTPPSGGVERRAMFSRTETEGACQPVLDGFGGLYYGTCDPSVSFCCIEEEGGCSPFPAADSEGQCTPASQAGEACGTGSTIQLCATGLECIDEVCVPEATQPLALGETCYDPDAYRLLGECADSWCDLFGTGVCEPQKAEGEDCWLAEECASNHCDSATMTCTVSQVCEG